MQAFPRTLAMVPLVCVIGGLVSLTGCSGGEVDFSTIARPDRAGQMDAFRVFIGDWDWKAEVLNAAASTKQWKGTAKWSWTLDERCLAGEFSAKCDSAAYDASGIWSWHPTRKKYIWWMFNNWGYPQEGTASYDETSRTWRMDYASVGLDGTPSYGRYEIRVVSDDELSWNMSEWADALHTIKKIDMKGTYRRRN